MSFNPNKLVPIEELGTVYPMLSISDNRGVWKVTNGALISSDFQRVIVGLPDDYANTTETDEWTE